MKTGCWATALSAPGPQVLCEYGVRFVVVRPLSQAGLARYIAVPPALLLVYVCTFFVWQIFGLGRPTTLAVSSEASIQILGLSGPTLGVSS